MALDLRLVRIVTEELINELQRLRDVEFADLLATVFGAWAFVLTLGLSTSVASLVTGVFPGLIILLSSGFNVYRVRQGGTGVELLNHLSLITGIWMLLSAAAFDQHIFLQYGNTFSGMWVGIASAYAAFLRQNDMDRETRMLVRGLHF